MYDAFNADITEVTIMSNLTRREVLLVYPNPLTTEAATIVFIMITNITDANKMST